MTLASIRPNLLDPAGGSSLDRSVAWINGVLFGEIAIGLCMLAIAFVGLALLTGQLPIRRGMRVVIGCFVLIGAPTIATGLMWAQPVAAPAPQPPLPADTASTSPRGDLEPSQYDPYAGASLRRN